MSGNINMIRIASKIKELFSGKIDMSDIDKDTANHFETRALAALALMINADLDEMQAATHITDGYHDMGIDAIYLDDARKELIIVQSKWRNNGKGSISHVEMQTFVEGIKRVIGYDLEGANNKIQLKKDDINFALTSMNYQIKAVFIHTGNEACSEYNYRPIKDLMAVTNDEISTLLVYEEINFKEIYEFLAQGQNNKAIDLDDIILLDWGKISEPYPVYYGVISAAAIGEWFRNYGNTLFAKNIRFYKGNTDVNEGIRKTLLNEPENFFYYNNGIKLLCNSIIRKAKDSTTNATGLFRLEGVSLVNGAQTAGTIGNVFIDNPEQVAKANVLVQLVDLSRATEEAYSKITKLSNTQNRIENKDFAALDPEQERIRIDLSFSHYKYLYKSGDKLTNMEDQLTFDEAIVAQACLHEEISYTILAKRNIGALSENINKPPYKVLFNSSTNSFSILNSVLIVRQVEKQLQRMQNEVQGRAKLVCIHGNRFIEHCVLQHLKSDDDFNKRVLDSTYISEEIKNYLDNNFEIVVEKINSMYADSYPANVFKNTAKCKELYEAVVN